MKEIQPFSTGTSHAEWQDVNCELCQKCYQPRITNGEQQWPTDETMRRYIKQGKECAMKYALDMAWINGMMPTDMAERIGLNERGYLQSQCNEFKQRGDDPRLPRKPRPRPVADNQLVMPFVLEGIEAKKEAAWATC